ncbi:hydrogenase maturation protease [candidate division KSB1 bacterium]|nr:hydrogenase maturation protease [candidate division KSB1 bacterium]
MNFDEFCAAFRDYRNEEIVFVGLGNRWRGDDGVGLLLVEQLQLSPRLAGAHFILAGTNPENYLQQILDCHARLVIFIDASRFEGTPGQLTWCTSEQIDTIGLSTHAFSIKLVEQYLLTEQPLEFKYLLIQPEQTSPGKNISNSIQQSLHHFWKQSK